MKRIGWLFLCLSLQASGQWCPDARRDFTWIIGNTDTCCWPEYGGVGLLFDGLGMDTFSPKQNINMDITNACISDQAGKLLFYTNGRQVADRNGHIMPNGDSINYGPMWEHMEIQFCRGYWNDQGALILPLPGQDSIFYIFHKKLDWAPMPLQVICPGLYLTIVNMNLNNGLGAVVEKNIPIIEDTLSMHSITAVRHGNGRDWWLLQPEFNNNAYYRLRLTPEGIEIIEKQYIGCCNTYGLGGHVFSPDGSIFITCGSYNSCVNQLQVFSFDRCLGELSNFRHYECVPNCERFLFTPAVSPNSRYLYIPDGMRIYQFDLQAEDIAGSMQIVAEWDGFADPPAVTALGQFQLGPNGEIYSNAGNTHFLNIIKSPDLAGQECQVVQHAIKVPRRLKGFLPNFPNFRLGPKQGSICDTLQVYFSNEQHEELKKNLLSVMPNPASDVIRINMLDNGIKDAVIGIYNLFGEKVMEKALMGSQVSMEIDISSLAQGMYLVYLKSEESIVDSRKLVKK